jgi:uncharacterized protein with NRDE domain
MCILFFHAKKFNLPGKFRVIIVSNRDEFYKRPAAPAHFWKERPDVFGGSVSYSVCDIIHSTLRSFDYRQGSTSG